MLEKQLALLIKEFSTLKEKITKFKQNQQTSLNSAQQKVNETNHKLELQMKENKENEAVLEQLLKEFKELEQSL
jgi:hypothetical protein